MCQNIWQYFPLSLVLITNPVTKKVQVSIGEHWILAAIKKITANLQSGSAVI